MRSVVPRIVDALRGRIGMSIDFRAAGLVTFGVEAPHEDLYVYLHILPAQEFRAWGHKRDHYDGTLLHDFGLGPFLLVCLWGF